MHHVLLLGHSYFLQTLVKHPQVQHTSWRTAFVGGCLAGTADLFQIVVGLFHFSWPLGPLLHASHVPSWLEDG